MSQLSDEKKITGNQIGFGIFLVVLLTAGYLISDLILSSKNPSNQDPEQKPVQVLSDYDQKETMKKVVVISNFDNTVNANFPSKKANVTLKATGTFARGYLYASANVEGKALQDTDPSNFDAVFASLVELTKDGSDSQFGGHLWQDESLDTPPHADYTEMLFKLSEVPYKKGFEDSSVVVPPGNWLEVFNDKNTREKVVAFSSTVKGTGVIQELSIYYECAEGSDCSITVE